LVCRKWIINIVLCFDEEYLQNQMLNSWEKLVEVEDSYYKKAKTM